jgi:hypothetical protein
MLNAFYESHFETLITEQLTKILTYITNDKESLDTKTGALNNQFNFLNEIGNENKNDDENFLKASSIVLQTDILKSNLPGCLIICY